MRAFVRAWLAGWLAGDKRAFLARYTVSGICPRAGTKGNVGKRMHVHSLLNHCLPAYLPTYLPTNMAAQARLVQQPLMRAVLADLALDVEVCKKKTKKKKKTTMTIDRNEYGFFGGCYSRRRCCCCCCNKVFVL